MRINKNKIKRAVPLYLILLPAVLATLIFSYVPMYGVVLAFQRYNPTKSMFQQEFVGLRYFERLFKMDAFGRILSNTLTIALLKIVTLLAFSLLLALQLTEVKNRKLRSLVQSLLTFPHFLSWIILGGLVKSVFAANGIINQFLVGLGADSPILFIQDETWFRVVLVITNLWQEAGFSGMIYTAAISGVDPTLYEAARLDGASHLQQAWHVTLKCIMPFVVLNVILSMGGILNAGFDQVFNLYNAVVIESADIIDTYVFRVGLSGGQYAFGTAVGLFKSVISCAIIGCSYWIANKKLGYRVF